MFMAGIPTDQPYLPRFRFYLMHDLFILLTLTIVQHLFMFPLMTNTQLTVLEQIKTAVLKHDKDLRLPPRPFRVIEPAAERWIAVHTMERAAHGPLGGEREVVLWIGPRGKVIDLTGPARGGTAYRLEGSEPVPLLRQLSS